LVAILRAGDFRATGLPLTLVFETGDFRFVAAFFAVFAFEGVFDLSALTFVPLTASALFALGRADVVRKARLFTPDFVEDRRTA
jgi:hypothetical protein